MDAGIILLDKSSGISSAAALAEVKRKFKLGKIGHAGTLDPMASGLLVCLFGSATRLASFAEGGKKTYSGVIQFGLRTDTDDITGNLISQNEDWPSFAAVEQAAESFVGKISQIPPAYSALKVEGKRAYALARQGKTVELAARTVEIERFKLEPLSENLIFFRMVCSKGTYVRAVARDLGEMLGCGATLASLRREVSEPFNLAQARKIEELDTDDFLRVGSLFPHLPTLKVEPALAKRLVCGEQEALRQLEPQLAVLSEQALYADSESGKALGLLVKQASGWKFGVNL